MSCFTEEQLSKISNLVKEIEKLSDIEKLMLYLQLPCGRPDQIEGKFNRANGKQHQDIFSKKPDQETTQTYTWILSHLEEDPNVSLPKQEVYDEYRTFCQANRFEPLCVADFGKAMKHAFPCIKPRRLGQRGNSRYCYSGLKKKYKIQPPSLPDISEMSELSPSSSGHFDNNSSHQQQQQQQQNYNNHFNQSPSASTSRSDVTKPATNECSPLNDIHHTNNHHQHVNQQLQQPQQHLDQRQHYAQPAGYEAMNLKIEHSSHHPHQHNHHQHQHHHQHHHHHHEHNQQPSSVLTHHSSANGESYVCDQLQHHLANGHKMDGHDDRIGAMPGANQISSSSATSEGSSQAASIIDGPQQMTPSCDDYGHQQGGAGLVHRHDYDYHGAIVQRFGTPDDDDYRHHYHDLNRPIVSEVIPFSQTGQYQPSVGFIYSQTSNQATHPLPPAQQQTITLNNDQAVNVHSAKQQHQLASQHPSRPPLSLDLGQQMSTSGQCGSGDACSLPTIQHHHQLTPNNNNNNNNNNVVPSTTGNNNTTTTTSTTTRNGRTERVAHPNHQYQQATVDGEQEMNHQPTSHNLQLNINNNNHLNNQSVDCCASPWASPASTPYPGMANLMMHDVQEYYAGECLRYDH